jgi:hypothetical protein
MAITKAHAKSLIEKVMKNYPELTVGGYGTFDNQRRDWIQAEGNPAKHAEDRANMLTVGSIEAFQKSCEWLQKVEKIKNPNTRIGSSYTLKHKVEAFFKAEGVYVPNGMFIAAAIANGFVIKRPLNSPNVFINVSTKSIRELETNVIPASNRNVKIDHNDPQIIKSLRAIEQTIEAIERKNKSNLKVDRFVKANLTKLKKGFEELKKQAIKRATAHTLIFAPLAWFAYRFADEAVGHLARAALEALQKLAGF